MLFDEDMSHFLDILRIPEYVDLLLSHREELEPLNDYLEESLKAQTKISAQLARELLEPLMELIDPLLRARPNVRTGP
jgi:hypothetical protein